MTPGDHYVLQPTVGSVDTELSGVDSIFGVGVCVESIGVDDLIGELAADDEGVLNNMEG